MKPSLPKAVLFDWDNTLVNTWPCLIAAMNHTLQAMGQEPWTEQQAKTRIAKSLRDSFPEMFGERWLEAKEIFLSTFRSLHLQLLEPLAGAAELLRFLRDNGIYAAVVSNKTGDILRTEAEALGWTPLFTHLVGAGDAVRDKPAPEPVAMALASFGDSASAETVWFVGDNAIDMHCGTVNSCFPVLIHPQPPEPAVFAEHPPRLHFNSCTALQDYLQQLA